VQGHVWRCITIVVAPVCAVLSQRPGFKFDGLGRQIVNSPAKAAPRNAAGVGWQQCIDSVRLWQPAS
jgi:hypothetical protein